MATLIIEISENTAVDNISIEQPKHTILSADDPLFKILGQATTEIGDLSTQHDQYLYQKVSPYET